MPVTGRVAQSAVDVVRLPVGGAEGVLAHLPRQHARVLRVEGARAGAHHVAVLRLQSSVT